MHDRLPLPPRDAFYRLRDDRTERCVPEVRRYQEVKILVRLASEQAGTFRGQVLAVVAANLLSRWCRQVMLAIPDVPLHERLCLKGWSTLRERIRAEVDDADPYGDFRFCDGPVPPADFVLGLGPESGPADYGVDGGGWVAIGTRQQKPLSLAEDPLNPIGPAIAACFGVAQAFKWAVGQPLEQHLGELQFSAFHLALARDLNGQLPPCASALDLGRTLMVGIGSVGSALLYFLRMFPLAGSLTLVDRDTVGVENLNRSPLFGVQMYGRNKAEVGADYLIGTGLHVQPCPGRYAAFLAQHPRRPHQFDLVLPLANEDRVRGALQHNLPPLMIYGTTTSDWGVNFGRHIPLVEDCLLCRYPEEPGDQTFACGTGAVPSPHAGKTVDAALPFLSPLAALLAVAEIAKLQLPEYPANHNYAYLDLKGPLTLIPHVPLRPQPTCLCRQQYRIFTIFNGGTRYAYLSG